MSTGGFSPRVERLWRESDHSYVSSSEVKNGGELEIAPPYVFMAWYVVKHRDTFTFYLYPTIEEA
jgi:hypothetical protein